ncbi:hypothetical protein JTE90_019950 [Oedothorax gibbosus]|uniref:Uncharacterized protein n=1 Tax=Oedothorax gibbosus TaxID=931172 RepID=A0AAV6UVL6_9ARAC|nr:hypothetical protein JTE90_019950 [Oedothorax gibbosus]
MSEAMEGVKDLEFSRIIKMSNTPPEEPGYDEVEEGSPFGGAECEESSPEPQQTEDAGEENLYPFDGCLSVEYFEDPGETSEQPLDNAAVYDGHISNVESTEQSFNESADTYVEYEPDVQVNEESYDPEDLQKTYNYDDFMYSNASSFDDGSNSNFEENREEPKGSALGRFNKKLDEELA